MILVCAATRAELRACERGLSAPGSPPTELLLTGVGAAHARAALTKKIEDGPRPTLVVSSGFAGALSSEWAPLAWVSAAHVGDWRDGRYDRVDVRLISLGLPTCAVVSADGLVDEATGDALAKAVSFDEPIVVDMESAALARVCARHDVPFAVARILSDTPAHRLPAFLGQLTAMMAAEDAKGRIAHAVRGVSGVMANPRALYALVKDGMKWVERLESGWRELAPSLARL